MKSFLTFLVLAIIAGGLYFTFRPKPDVPLHRYSAENVFYLRQYVSVKTSRGIIGLIPGQQVCLDTRVRPVAGCVAVTDGSDTMMLVRDVLTHDIDEAQALQANDMQSQALLQADLAQIKQSTELQNQAAQAVMADEVNTQGALQASANTVGNYRTRLNDGTTQAAGGSYSGLGYYPVVARETAGRAGAAGAFVPAPATVSSVSNSSYRTQSSRVSVQVPTDGPRRPGTLVGDQAQ